MVSNFTEYLDYWAHCAPDRIFLAQRKESISFQDFRQAVRRTAQGLLNSKLTLIQVAPKNSIEHAILAVAAMYVGLPYVHGLPQTLVVDCEPMDEVDDAHRRVTPDTVAKILDTSGSSGEPKAIVNTHGMLTSNQEMIRHAIPSLRTKPPILCDWLPWKHTYGGSHNFGIALSNGGTMYIDEGRPDSEEHFTNLCEVRPTLYFDVPRGYEMLLPALRDRAFAAQFFSRLELLFCAGAALSDELREKLVSLSPVPILIGYGATETAPMVLYGERILKPAPGLEVKLEPVGDKLELCVRGPNVTPSVTLDHEGYYKTGDAFRHVGDGLVFDGRLRGNFKLSNGKWAM